MSQKNQIIRKDSIKLLKINHNAKDVELKLPPIKSVNASEEEKWLIKSLPSNWVPNEQPSKIVENLLSAKEEEHNKHLEEMKAKMRYINKEIERKIIGESQKIKIMFDDCSKTINEEIGVIKYVHESKKPNLSGDIYAKTIRLINECTSRCEKSLEEYNEFLDILEKDRSDKFKSILKEKYEKLNEIFFKLPQQIQESFDLEVLNINQIVLNNYRCYTEINKQLNLKLQHDKRLWIMEINEYERDFLINQIKALSDIKKPSPVILKISNSSFLKIGVEDNDINKEITLEYLDMLAKKYSNFLTTFKNRKNKLNTSIDEVIQKIFATRFDELHNVLLNLEEDTSKNIDEQSSFYQEIFRSFFAEPENREINEFTLELIIKWEKLIYHLRMEFEKTVTFLKDALLIWDNHFKRIGKLKDLTQMNLINISKQNISVEQKQSEQINVLIDQLREASSEKELNNILLDLKKRFSIMINIFNSNHQKEIQVFDYYKTRSLEEIEIVMNEVLLFLKKHEKPSDVDPTLKRGRDSTIELENTVTLPLILIFENEIKSLHNWTFGLHEIIDSVNNTSRNFFIKKSYEYIYGQTLSLEKKLEIKIDLCKPKLEKISNHIYKRRLNELNNHAKHLEKHLLSIEEELKNLQSLQQLYKEKCCAISEEFSKVTSNKIVMIKYHTKRSGALQIIKQQLEFEKNSAKKKLEDAKNQFVNIVDKTINKNKLSNVDFVKNMKFFNEGGNYGAQEFSDSKMIIKQSISRLNKEASPIIKELNKTFSYYLNELNTKEIPVQNLIPQSEAELKFHEFTQHTIINIKNLIKEETFNIKQKFQIIPAYFLRLKLLSANNLGSLKYLRNFIQNCEFLGDHFKDFQKIIIQESPFIISSELLDLRLKTSLRFSLKELSMKDKPVFSKILFEDVPRSDDYMSKILTILSDALNSFDEKSLEFYADKHDFLYKGLIVRDRNMFMIEIVARCLYYQLQSESFWLKTSITYMDLVNESVIYIREYYTKTILKYVENQLIIFDKSCLEHKTKVKTKKQNLEKQYLGLYKRLKTLHGHPNNSNLLKELNSEIEALNQHVLDQNDEMNKYFEENIKEAILHSVQSFKENITISESNLRENLEKFSLLINHGSNLMKQVKERILYLKDVIENCDYFECFQAPSKTDIADFVSELKIQLNLLKTGLDVTSDNIAEFNESIRSIEESVADISLTTQNFKSESELFFDVNQFVQLYQNKLNRCILKIKKLVDFQNMKKFWNALWDSDTKTLGNLYSVKYDCLYNKNK